METFPAYSLLVSDCMSEALKEFAKIMAKANITPVIYLKCPFCNSKEVEINCNDRTWECGDCKKIWDSKGEEVP